MDQLIFINDSVDMSLAMHGTYNLGLVLLSYLPAAFAAYAALKLSQRIIDADTLRLKYLWMAAGAIVMGVGIWSMHFVGMLAYKMSMPVYYSPSITLLSMLPAIFASAIALEIISRNDITFRLLLSRGVLMGLGIGAMHYTGMAAMRMNAVMLYDPELFILSILVAVILATLALYIKFIPFKYTAVKTIISPLTMGLAVTGMHYTAMSAVFFFPSDSFQSLGSGLDPILLGILTSIGAFLIISLAIVATIADFHFAGKKILAMEVSKRKEVEALLKLDIDKRKRIEEKLTYQASHDALTGLVNRSEFERRAKRLLSTIREDKKEHALIFMDLDQFKVVNDTCGHIAGDELLRQLSSVLVNTIRYRDTLARLGGDEFVVLIEHCAIDDAYRLAMSLQKTVQEYQFSWEDRFFKVGVSIGMVAITEEVSNITELLRQADAACYMAKDAGRNRIHIYRIEDSETAKHDGEMQWITKIHQAIDENRFCLYAQLIVPLHESNDKHYELLLRMIDGNGNVITPETFLSAAERYNIISKLDAWVVEKTLGLLKVNPEFLKQINFCSINLSGQSITEPNFLSFVIEELDKSEIDTNKLCFEITETAAISNLSAATTFISTLKGLGCRFALDDFGSGLSSFAYLKNFSVDYLKIDGLFVRDILDDPIDYAMVKSINEIGQIMGMKTIAEYVESKLIQDMLIDIGVDYAQGYSIKKPQPLTELLDLPN